ncbi:hypothetical protein HAX54_047662, partial [Datura stramonium]|nr:hypothetical protein [Datura stramonium]
MDSHVGLVGLGFEDFGGIRLCVSEGHLVVDFLEWLGFLEYSGWYHVMMDYGIDGNSRMRSKILSDVTFAALTLTICALDTTDFSENSSSNLGSANSDFVIPLDPRVSGNDSPVAIVEGRGREQEVRSICSLGISGNEVGSFHRNSLYSGQSLPTSSNSTGSDSTISTYSGQSTPSHSNGTRSDPTISAGQGMQRTNKNSLVHDKEQMQIDIPSPPSCTDQVMQYIRTVET